MDKQAKKRKRSTLGWVLSFAGGRKGSYVGSTLLAIMSVVSGFIPYIFMAKIMRGLLEKTADFPYCLTQCLWMALFFVLNRLFHAFSTTLSHRATFEVLANIRRRLTKKLSRMPLGDVLDESSGTYKNIIVERVDSIETKALRCWALCWCFCSPCPASFAYSARSMVFAHVCPLRL